jgi:NAD(P)-dependent dehydrogenase (short-subunit alcohol dehydrogenase family)
MPSFLGMEGMHVLVTGAAGGIGGEIVKMCLEQGAVVSLHYRRESTLSTVQDLLKAYPGRVCCVQADARIEADVERAFAEANKALGVVTGLVVNHAVFVGEDAPMVDMTVEQWKSTFDINLTGSFLFVRAYLRQLRAHVADLTPAARSALHPSVVLVGSTAGKFGEAGHADYAAAKSALMGGFLLSLKNEIVQIVSNGRANAVNPGWTLTAMAKGSVERGEHLKALQTTPVRKIATTKEVASAILFFLSPAASHISGTSLQVDGGMEVSTYTRTQPSTHKRTRKFAQMHMHTHTYTNAHTHTHAHICTHTPTRASTHVHTYTHSHTHTQILTHAHTHRVVCSTH